MALPGPQLLFVGSAAAVGVAGTVAFISARNPDDAFVRSQRLARSVPAPAVERVVKTAPYPVPPHRRDGVRARCRSRGRGELANPWSCVVSYRSGARVRYSITIRSDGRYYGAPIGGRRTITGCCVRISAR